MINSQLIQTFFIALLQGSGAISFLLLDMFVARLLGSETYGIFSTILAWTYILGILATLGTNQLVLRFIGVYLAQENFSSLRKLIQLGRRWVLMVSAFILIVSISIFFMRQSNFPFYSYLIGFASIPFIAFNYLRQSSLRSLGHPIRALLPDFFIRPILSFLIIILLIYIFKASLNLALILAAITSSIFLVYLIGEFWLQRALNLLPKTKVKINDNDLWLGISIKLLLLIGLNLLTFRIDILMISVLGEESEIGIYAASSKIAEIVVFGLVCSNIIIVPLISKYYAFNKMEQLQTTISKFVKTVSLISLPIIIILIGFSDRLLNFFGPDFTNGKQLLIILIFGQVCSLLCGPAGAVLMMTGHEKTALKITLLSAIINIAMNFLFIPSYGMYGAAYATSISLFIINLMQVFYVIKLLSINTTVFNFMRST